ncbi:hypothetical protein HN014_10920 [Aquimarina sp. TRL1]|uniref:hypothetical protein n=1 Tax=Aquimarina sp. (strain TRL1) TaxID=2736252 RepID=UPI00158AA3C3|nr:hypothetical protein [Aquimarina sp. TRL1]QKX05405.1 hypothetical protein HN014_10920 [Aquimarina sp. TRL1]
MRKSFSILNSDQINKYGYLIPVSVMEDMMWEKATVGVPMHLGHNMHRPIGCMIPYGLYFKPHLVRQLGLSLAPESDEDSKEIIDFKRYSQLQNLKEDITKNDGKLLELLKDKLSDDFKYVGAGTLTINDKEITSKYFPELFEGTDKNGLIYISDIEKKFTYKYHGVFIHNELPLCIYSHDYFRKSLSRLNNFHHLFLDEFMSHRGKENVTLRIAIDRDMIGYAPDFRQTLEFEYWFGPKYNDDISNISPGLTKHSSSEFEKYYYEVSSTEFYWNNNNNYKEFELEELKENEAPMIEDFYGCRYVHSIYDTSKKTFIHFDGAIRGYNTELYLDRIEQKLTEFGRKSDYKKLFRIDGSLKLKDWKSLITKYMQGNPLIYEYFEVEKPASQFDRLPKSKNLLEELVPHNLSKEDGIRLLVTYHKENKYKYCSSHNVSIYDVVQLGDISYSTLEVDVLEIQKALKRLGKNLHIKEDTLFGNIKDIYWNIPCIFHSDKNPQKDLELTISALKLVFSKMIKRDLDSIISFTLAWNMEDKEVRVSVCGHIELLHHWLSNFDTIPTIRNDFKKWLENQREYLNSNFQQVTDKPRILDIVQFDGVIYLKRQIVGEEFSPVPKEQDDLLICEYKIPNQENEKYSSLIDGSIRPVMAYIIDKQVCSKTNLEYSKSPYSKFLDNDVHKIVEKVSGLSFYWTDKPIY